MAWNDKIFYTICSCGCGGSLWIKRYHLLPSRLRNNGVPRFIRGHIRGELHNGWKGDHVLPEVGRGRARSKYKSIGTCQSCQGMKAKDRHHIDGNTMNNSTKNIRFLCRRCHMIEDGRLPRLIKMARSKRGMANPPIPCSNCGVPSKPLRKSLCHSCNEYLRHHGKSRPKDPEWFKIKLSERRAKPCPRCKLPAGRFGIVVRGMCRNCYCYWWRKKKKT